MWVIGFTFVALVTHKFRNRNPFKGPDGDYIDIMKTVVFSLIFFGLAGMVILRQRKDLSSYCNKALQESYDDVFK